MGTFERKLDRKHESYSISEEGDTRILERKPLDGFERDWRRQRRSRRSPQFSTVSFRDDLGKDPSVCLERAAVSPREQERSSLSLSLSRYVVLASLSLSLSLSIGDSSPIGRRRTRRSGDARRDRPEPRSSKQSGRRPTLFFGIIPKAEVCQSGIPSCEASLSDPSFQGTFARSRGSFSTRQNATIVTKRDLWNFDGAARLSDAGGGGARGSLRGARRDAARFSWKLSSFIFFFFFSPLFNAEFHSPFFFIFSCSRRGAACRGGGFASRARSPSCSAF